MDDAAQQKSDRFWQWFGIIAGLASIASFLSWFLPEKRRDLTVYANPAKSIIVRAGQSSDLHVDFKGQPVTTDVTAVQVAIWNDGDEPIHAREVLSPVMLRTSSQIPILEARIRHVSRSVIGATLDLKDLPRGAVGVSWNVLEKDDGAVIQTDLRWFHGRTHQGVRHY